MLLQLVAELAAGRIRVVDLTQTLSPDFPQIVLPPEMGQAWPFRIEEASRYDARGPGWYWNNFSCSEHTGTHFDAPIHWISGRHLPDNSTDTIPATRFVAPACVLDCSREAAADADFLLTVDFLRKWERRHGRIPAGSWILMRTDWSKRLDPVAYQNLDETGQHTPGPDADAVKFLVDDRQVLGFGSEAIGTDAGQAFHLKPPYPCHYYMHGSGRFGLQCLTNLDLLPPTGAIVIAAPLKIKEGSGSPLRVLALVPSPATRAGAQLAKATPRRKAVLGTSADERCRHPGRVSARRADASRHAATAGAPLWRASAVHRGRSQLELRGCARDCGAICRDACGSGHQTQGSRGADVLQSRRIPRNLSRLRLAWCHHGHDQCRLARTAAPPHPEQLRRPPFGDGSRTA